MSYWIINSHLTEVNIIKDLCLFGCVRAQLDYLKHNYKSYALVFMEIGVLLKSGEEENTHGFGLN